MALRETPQRDPKGVYSISANGNSKAVNCARVLDGEDVPSELGDKVTVVKVEDPERGTYLEIIPEGTQVSV